MRLRLTNGSWYETEEAIHVTEKLRFTRRGNWVFHKRAEGILIEEFEAVEVMLSDGRNFEDCPGYYKLPVDVQLQLQTYLDAEFNPGDEV